MEKGGCIYILTNKNRTTLYIGVTSDLISRMNQHRNKRFDKSFSSQFNLYILVYYESFSSIEEAIRREKQLKSGSRKKKMDLINKLNPEWEDLYERVLTSW